MAAPVPLDKGTASKTGAASGIAPDASPAFPATVAANDVCYMQVVNNGAAAAGSKGVINTPAGWQQITQVVGRSSGGVFGCIVAWFWRRCDGTEDGSTVTVSTTHNSTSETGLHAQIYRVSGLPTTGLPWEALAVKHNGDGNTTMTWDAVHVGGTERTVLAFVGVNDDATPGTPTGYSATAFGVDTSATGKDTALACFDKANTDNGDAATATGGDTDGWVTLHLVCSSTAQADFSLGVWRGRANDKTSGTTVAVNPTAAIPVGRMLVAYAVSDNAAAASAETSEHTMADSQGHTWTKLREHCGSGGAANAGETVSIWATKLTTQLETTDTVTLTLSDTRDAKAILLVEHSLNPDRTFALVGDEGAAGSGTTYSVVLAGLDSGGYLLLGAMGWENSSTTSAVQDADYVPGYSNGATIVDENRSGTTGGTGTTNVQVMSAARLANPVTGDTFANTISSSSDWTAILVALEGADDEEEPEPPAAARHYGLLLGVG